MVDYEKLVQENRKRRCKNPYIVVINDSIYQLGQNDIGEGYSIEKRVGNVIRVKDAYTDMQTKIKKCRIYFKSIFGDFEEVEVPTKILSDKNKVVELADYGMDVNSNNAKYILEHLNNEMRSIGVKRLTTQMGIIPYGNSVAFVGQESFMKKKATCVPIPVDYSGDFLVKTDGDKAVYMNMIQTCVCESYFLSAMMLIALSAPLVGYIGKDCNISNILVHISGDSSTGKSTALKFAVSLFGAYGADGEKKGLFTSWNSTDNALMETLANNQGIPIAIDELGMSKSIDYSSLIYRIVEGKNKARMKFGEGNEPIREWHTTIISSGERMMSDESDRATGQNMRIIQIVGGKWTRSAGESREILSVIGENFGFLGLDFVKAMFSISKKSLLEAHQREREKELKMLQCGNLNERTADTLALIMLGGRILKKVGVNINQKMVRELLVYIINETRSAENSIGERAFNRLNEEISSKQNYIERRTSNGHCIEMVTDGYVWAVGYCVSAADDYYEIAIPVDRLRTFLQENGYKSPDIIFDDWVERKKIKTNHRGKYTHPVKIGNVNSVKCIKVDLRHEKK